MKQKMAKWQVDKNNLACPEQLTWHRWRLATWQSV